MVIDFRIRPPIGGFLDMVYPYDFSKVDPLAESLGLKPAESAGEDQSAIPKEPQ